MVSWRPSWILDPIYFLSTFLSQVSFKSVGISVQEKFKIDFQDGDNSGHHGFLIRTILAAFVGSNLGNTPVKFDSNWPRGVRRSYYLEQIVGTM